MVTLGPFKRSALAVILFAPVPAVSAVAFTSTEAYASGACLSTYLSRFDGNISTSSDPYGGNYEGAVARIINNPANVCTGGLSPNFSAVWDMVHGNAASYNDYAQVGYFQSAGSCPYFFTEYNISGNPNGYTRSVKSQYGCLTANSSNQYWVQDTGSAFRLNVDTTILTTTPFNPASVFPSPWNLEWDAESKYIQTDIPTTNFSSMQAQLSNGAFTNTLPTLYVSCPWPARYILNDNGLSSNSFAIQTSGTSTAMNC